MSGVSSSNKKRRLGSEQSQGSGITNLSDVTQISYLTSEHDDSVSDSSTNNVNNGISAFSKNCEETKAKCPPERSIKRPQRKRQVSWCLENEDDDEEVLKSQSRMLFQYDNNFNGTNDSRRRTRRATESSLGNHDVAYFQRIQSQAESPNSQSDQYPLRSNTTSQIYGHEKDIQRQRMIENHYRHYPPQDYRRLSRSETCLKTPNLHVSPFPSENSVQNLDHAYQSLQQQTTLKSAVPKSTAADGHLDTIVTFPNGGPNYIHPVTQVQKRANSCDLLNNTRYFREEEEGLSGDSTYIDVRQNPDAASLFQVLSCRSCGDSFYRKGFYVLLVLNVIFLLLNIYFAMKQDDFVDWPPVGAQTANVCVECDSFPINERNLFQIEDNNCCDSVEETLPRYVRATETRIRHLEERYQDSKVPVLQLRADINKQQFVDSITWREREDINTLSVKIVNRTSVEIPKSGYYYVYSRIHYKKTDGNDTSLFTIGHKVMKYKPNGRPKQIDKIVQRCLPSSNSGDVRHTNHIGSVQYLQESERVFIQLDHTKYFDPDESIFGMFLVAT